MNRTILLLCGLVLLMPAAAFSQINGAGTLGQRKDHPDEQFRGQGGQFREKMAGFRTRKLIEYLGLTAAEAARLKPAMKALDNNRKQYLESRNQALNALSELLKTGAPAREIQNAVAALKVRESEFQDRERVLNENVLDLLTPDQQAKYFLFSRYFAGEVHKSLYRMAENQGRDSRGADRQGKPAVKTPASH